MQQSGKASFAIIFTFETGFETVLVEVMTYLQSVSLRLSENEAQK